MLAVTNAGTIPDRGLYTVTLPEGGRVGELDEEMVYESRPGEVFVLGSTTWKISEITHDRVIVTPAPGQAAAKLPFWHGDSPGRPLELGKAVGAFIREIGALEESEALATLSGRYRLDRWAAANLTQFIADERDFTGVLPTDRTIVVEQFRDEIGDWRTVVLSPFGARVHAPWALAARRRYRDAHGTEVDVIWSDDGIIFRFPDVDEPPSVEELLVDPEEVEELVLEEAGDSALFTSRFREAAARSLLLPRGAPGRVPRCGCNGARLPACSKSPSSTDRSPSSSRPTAKSSRTTSTCPLWSMCSATSRLDPSGSASSTSPDRAPLQRRSCSTSSPRSCTSTTLLSPRSVLPPSPSTGRCCASCSVTPSSESCSTPMWSPRSSWNCSAWLPIARSAPPTTSTTPSAPWGRSTMAPSSLAPPILPWRRRGSTNWSNSAASSGSGWQAPSAMQRLRMSPGCATLSGSRHRPVSPPPFWNPWPTRSGTSSVALPVPTGHSAWTMRPPTSTCPSAAVTEVLGRLQTEGRVAPGSYRPGGSGQEWVDTEVLRRLRRRSLAVLRRGVEAVDGAALGRFLPGWHGVGQTVRPP